jgi:hypothetical protein
VSHSAVFVTTFLAAAVEVIEMVMIIVVASAPFAGGGRPSLAPHRALAVVAGLRAE